MVQDIIPERKGTMTRKKITSVSNELIKRTAEIAAARQRGGREFFVAEGLHALNASMATGAVIKEIFYTEEFGSTDEGAAILDRLAAGGSQPSALIEVTSVVFAKIAGTETPQGILAVIAAKHMKISDLKLSASPLLAVCDGIQDPGNLGTIIRLSDAAGAEAVVVLPDSCDPYAPKAVRSSAGSIFNLPVVSCRREELVEYLSDKSIKLYIAEAKAEKSIYETDLRESCALAFGNESRGISAFLSERADGAIKIPILGKAESLNAAVAASICLYEAVRQRGQRSRP
jgi:TrmH family RNA methyltransferase